MSALHSLLCCAALALPLAASAENNRSFGGKVLQLGPKPGVFVMQGGASKRYPKPTIVYDRATRWTGVPRPEKKVRVGDSVHVVATLAKDGNFHAVSIEIEPVGARPSLGHFSGASR
jgi:hypothetical protein